MQRFVALAVFLCGSLHAETALVLPFFNQSKSAGLDWVGESIAESVGDSLVSDGLLVLDREDRLSLPPLVAAARSRTDPRFHHQKRRVAGRLQSDLRILRAAGRRRTGPGAIQGLPAHHRAHFGSQEHAPERRARRTRRARKPRPPAGTPGMAGSAIGEHEDGPLRRLVYGGPPRRAPGRRGELCTRPPGSIRRAAPPVLYPGRTPGPALLPALLSTRKNLLGKKGLQGGLGLVRARPAGGPALPGGAVLPGPVPLSQRRFQRRRRMLSVRRRRHSVERGLQ